MSLPTPPAEPLAETDLAGAAPALLTPSSGERARAVTVSVSSQLAVRIVHFGLNVISSVLLIRYLSPAGFGDWVFVATVTVLVGLVGDFGLDKTAIRVVVADPDREGTVIGTTIVARLLLGAIGIVVVQLVLASVGARAEIRVAGLVSSVVFLVQAMRAIVISFHVRVQQQFDALVVLAAELLEVALLVILIRGQAGLVALVAAPVVGLCLGVALAWWVARRRFDLRLRLDVALGRELLVAAWPVAVALVVGVLYLRVDSLILVLFRPRAEVGLYGAAFQPIEYAFLASAILSNVLYPLAAGDHARSDRARLETMHRQAVVGLLSALLVAPALLFSLAGPVVSSVYGPAFEGSVVPLQVLSLALIGLVLSAWHAIVLLAIGRQRLAAVINLIGLFVAIVLDLLLIPTHGPFGAAVATLLGSWALLAASVIVLARAGLTVTIGPLVRALGAGLGLWGTTALASIVLDAPWWVQGLLALATWPLWLRLTGVLPTLAKLRGLRDLEVSSGIRVLKTPGEREADPPRDGASLPSVSVIFPTYNRSAVIRRTIEHLLACDYPPELLEVIVADNSSDDTPAMVRGFEEATGGSVRLLASEHALPAIKRNEGLRLATGDLVIFLNDDLWVRPDFLRVHAAAHAELDRPAAVVGQCPQSEQMPPAPFSDWYRPFDYDAMADLAGCEVDARFFWSMNLSMPRQYMLDRNLVFHEDWANMGHEDIELGWRWTRAGLPVVYEPEAWGEHYHPHDLSSACRLQQAVGRGLRDLDVLVDDPGLLARYGVFTWKAPPRLLARSLARRVLFNGVTAPWLRDRWSKEPRDTRVRRWAYWKILLHHTNVGHREQGPRSPTPLVTGPEPSAVPPPSNEAPNRGHVVDVQGGSTHVRP